MNEGRIVFSIVLSFILNFFIRKSLPVKMWHPQRDVCLHPWLPHRACNSGDWWVEFQAEDWGILQADCIPSSSCLGRDSVADPTTVWSHGAWLQDDSL